MEGEDTIVLGNVLSGMGGVGKTQLAAAYARTALNEGRLDILVWITASARSAIVAGYAQAGVELCRADPLDPEGAARAFLSWLTPKAGARLCRWLIVLDDVNDPADLQGLWPPPSQSGRTLVTTRRRDAALTGAGRRRIDVGLFAEAEAVSYLTTSLAAHGREEATDQLAALAADLGHLPLALAQAAAYLIDSGESAAHYRELLADRTTTLADTAPDVLPDDNALPLAAAWSLSLDHADQLRPVGLARPMLQMAALLDANGIPEDVLTSETTRTYLAARRSSGSRNHADRLGAASVGDAHSALRALHRVSLIDHDPSTPHEAVRVHQLIQRATRDTLATHERATIARTAADALTAVWPEIERDTALARALRANADALIRHAEDALYLPDAHSVLYRTGESLGESGQTTAAIDHYRHLSTALHYSLGPDHPDTLTTRSNLARWRGEAGDAVGAAEASADLLEDMVRVLGA
ncbi:NB-ARC domain-containing protein, partial [Streptomyces sp. NPDC059168]|uniref:NB-ARC domain-containing protein n=1 Tax=Streptomyces sp. NPDC059168 TaxID=3346753 RepID=UPI0036CDEB95